MSTEKQQQIAREAAKLIIADLNGRKGLHVDDLPPDIGDEIANGFRDIILSAIERAREAEIKTFLPMVKAEIAAAQPQHTEQQEWWREVDADGCWHIGVGDKGFADLGEGSEARVQAKIIVAAHNADLSTAQEALRQRFEKAEIENERQVTRLERVIKETHELHKVELDRLKADYTRELNAKLVQINAQAETIRDERERDAELIERERQKYIIALRNYEAKHDVEVRKPLVDTLKLLEYDENGHITAWPTQKTWADALAKIKEQRAAICCPICAHITSYPARAEVVKCKHCLRSFQLEPNQERKP